MSQYRSVFGKLHACFPKKDVPYGSQCLDVACKDCSGNVAFDEQRQGCPIADHDIHVDAGRDAKASSLLVYFANKLGEVSAQ